MTRVLAAAVIILLLFVLSVVGSLPTTFALVVASLILFVWVLAVLLDSTLQAVTEAGRTAVLQFDERDVLELVAEKRAALTALKESELDYETDKVGESEYQEVHAAAAGEAIDVMKRLDAFRAGFRYQARIDRDLAELGERPVDVSSPARGGRGPSLLVPGDHWEEESALSPAARVRARRRAEAESGAAVANAGSDAVVAAVAAVAEPAVVKTGGGFCAACGQSLVAGARFCSECGHKVGAPVEDGS